MNKYNDIIEKIDTRLSEITEYSDCTYSKLLEAERYSIMAGGKHLRALLLVKVALMGGASLDVALDVACALEMVHTYSLIHDDLPEMDNDDMRRGKPTCHVKYGSDVALLAGDALLTKAFGVISKCDGLDDFSKVKCIQILSDACGEHGMLAGQVIDKAYENTDISLEILHELQNLKTGALFLASVKMGCAISDIDGATKQKLVQYIKHLGLAFQIKDDILDVTSDEATLGKPVNSDVRMNKSTFVSLLGMEKAKLTLDEELAKAKKCIDNISDPFFMELADYFAGRNK